MAAAKAPPKIYRVVSPFIAWEDGHEVPYLVNDIVYTADHPVVRKNGGNFVEIVPVGPAGPPGGGGHDREPGRNPLKHGGLGAGDGRVAHRRQTRQSLHAVVSTSSATTTGTAPTASRCWRTCCRAKPTAAGLVDSRNTVVAAFLDGTDDDWFWWLDDDMGFAPDTLDRLRLAADPVERPIVGALCFYQYISRPARSGPARHPRRRLRVRADDLQVRRARHADPHARVRLPERQPGRMCRHRFRRAS